MPGGGTGIEAVFGGSLAQSLGFGPPGQGGYVFARGASTLGAWGILAPLAQQAPGGSAQVDDTFGAAIDLSSVPAVVGSKNWWQSGTPTDLVVEPQWNPVWRCKVAMRRTTTTRFFAGLLGGDVDSFLDASDTGRPQVAFRWDTSVPDATMQFVVGDAALRTFTPSTFVPVADVPFFLTIQTSDLGASWLLEIRDEDYVVIDSLTFNVPGDGPGPAASSALVVGGGGNELSGLAPSAVITRLFYSGLVNRI